MSILKYTGERIIPDTMECESSHNAYMYQEHITRYEFAKQLGRKSVLDVGCGVGYGANHLANNECKVDAFDMDEEAISYAKSKYASKPINFYTADATNIKLADKYDLITCFEVIEHVKLPGNVLSGIKAHLSQKGVALISTPRFNGDYRSKYHFYEYTHDEFYQLLGNYFNNVEMYFQAISFCSCISKVTQKKADKILNLNDELSKNNADMFVAVVSDSPLPLMEQTFVYNNCDYLYTLEKDVAILKNDYKNEHEYRQNTEALLIERTAYIEKMEALLMERTKYIELLEKKLQRKR